MNEVYVFYQDLAEEMWPLIDESLIFMKQFTNIDMFFSYQSNRNRKKYVLS